MQMAQSFLSKSRYLSGLQCPKYLWLQVNQPDSIPERDAQTQYIFDQGQLVEQLARKLFPDSIEVPFEDFMGNIRATKRLLKERQTLFQAGVMADNQYSRLDVLRPDENGKWDIIEIKSSTRVKDENIDDVSFQKHCCEKQGLVISRCYLMHINSQYVRQGEIEPARLFAMDDITEAVSKAQVGIEDRIKAMQEVLGSSLCPSTRVGLHCREPYECPVTECRDALPENNILYLYRGGKKSFDLLYRGILQLRNIPDDIKLTEPQTVQKWCDINSCAFLEKVSIQAFLKTLKYPVYYLDFETLNTAIPLFDGIRPYQQVPFQFSLHIIDKPGSMPWHFSYLANSPADPRPQFLVELQRVSGTKGSIVVYNQAFEEGILRELGKAYPEYKEWTDSVCSRLVDLLLPFRNFYYYHPDQKGSASIKSVLPALTGQGYDELDIHEGETASLTYLAMTYGNMPAIEKDKTRTNLEIYCRRDTEGMIWIMDKLREICGMFENTRKTKKTR
jgi:hypothetical protein